MAQKTILHLGYKSYSELEFNSVLNHWSCQPKQKGHRAFWTEIIICWRLWTVRNNRIFNATPASLAMLP